MTGFLNFLRDQIRQARDIENTAHDLLHNAADDAGYREAMHRKAELLANLSANAAPFLDALGLERRPMIEHKLDVLASSEYLVDLGPEGGEAGGKVVATGTPERVSRSRRGHTAPCLREYLKQVRRYADA